MSKLPIFGIHAVSALVEKAPERLIELHVSARKSDRRLDNIVSQAQQLGLPVFFQENKTLVQLSRSEQHQGVVAIINARSPGNQKALLAKHQGLSVGASPLYLILDQIQDPHNFGAILRTAAAVGVDGVVFAKDNSSPLSGIVHKVASGALESLDLYRVSNLGRTIRALKDAGVWIVGTTDQATNSLYNTDLTIPIALVVGAEGKGMRKLTEKLCDHLIAIPMKRLTVSSLNVSVATGVVLYETLRQRQGLKP